MTYDNIKSHEKLGLYPLTRRYIFGENTKWGQSWPLSYFKVKERNHGL